MGFRLEEVVPWGRSHAEYRDMFALTRTDLEKDILGNHEFYGHPWERATDHSKEERADDG